MKAKNEWPPPRGGHGCIVTERKDPVTGKKTRSTFSWCRWCAYVFKPGDIEHDHYFDHKYLDSDEG